MVDKISKSVSDNWRPALPVKLEGAGATEVDELVVGCASELGRCGKFKLPMVEPRDGAVVSNELI